MARWLARLCLKEPQRQHCFHPSHGSTRASQAELSRNAARRFRDSLLESRLGNLAK